MIKAIQTNYKGYRFRSRLEARWAVFFDALGIQWQYEPEGFELPDGTRYLPDFYLPRFHGNGLWVEVKPKGDPATKARAFVAAARNCLLILDGEPDFRTFTLLEVWEGEQVLIEDECSFIDKYLPGGGTNAAEYRLYFQSTPDDARWCGPRVTQAIYAARSARFEHGESGAWRK